MAEAAGFLRSRTVVGSVSLGVVVFVLIFGLFLTTMPLLVEREFGIGASGRGLLLGIPALTSTTAALVLGRLQARFGVRRLIQAASLTFAAAFLVIAGAPVLAVLVAGALLYGAAEGVVIPSLQNVVASAAPASSRGSVVAIWVAGARAGQTIGPLLAGVSIARVGAPGTFGIGAGIAAALFAVLLLATPTPGGRASRNSWRT
jgi:MFS transporter, ACDE family, multidrug resistance protein